MNKKNALTQMKLVNTLDPYFSIYSEIIFRCKTHSTTLHMERVYVFDVKLENVQTIDALKLKIFRFISTFIHRYYCHDNSNKPRGAYYCTCTH